MLKTILFRITHRIYEVKYIRKVRNKGVQETHYFYGPRFKALTPHEAITKIVRHYHCKRSDIYLLAIK